MSKLLGITTGRADFLLLEHLLAHVNSKGLSTLNPGDFSLEYDFNRSHISQVLKRLAKQGLVLPYSRILYNIYDISQLQLVLDNIGEESDTRLYRGGYEKLSQMVPKKDVTSTKVI